MSKRFPKTDIFPVALFTDKSEKWLKEPEKEIKIVCLDETYMYFKYKLIRMKDHEAQTYSNTKNRFIAVLRSAMRRGREREKIIKIMESTENRRDMMLTLSQELKKRGFEKGIKEGILKGKLETAEALLKEKMSAEKISQITGLPLIDIKKLIKNVQ